MKSMSVAATRHHVKSFNDGTIKHQSSVGEVVYGTWTIKLLDKSKDVKDKDRDDVKSALTLY